MTERQGGSDVRANITRAEPVGDGAYEIHGHKWFCSYPPCDVFLVLAQAPGGLSCFLVERGCGDGVPAPQGQARDALAALLRGRVPRRARAADRRGRAWRAGDHPDGQPHPAGLPARGDDGASARNAGGDPPRPSPLRLRKLLAEQPAMRNVLADLAVESEAATVAAMRVARAYDEASESAFRRFATAVMKYWVCKRAPGARRRGARVPGRQRVRRGLGDAAALPRRPAGLDLGGLWQRGRARRAAGDGQGAGGAARLPGRVRAGGRGRAAARRPPGAGA